MPRKKWLEEYPEEYFQLFERAYDEDGIVVELDSHEAAKALRAHLYTFRRVLRKAEGHTKLKAKADGVKLAIDLNKLVLKKRNGFGELKIKEALNG